MSALVCAQRGQNAQGEAGLLGLGSFALLAGIALATAGAAPAATAGERPLVVAHRGGALLRPENTIPAFDHAVKLGVDMLEFDILMTKDDQLVVSHDSSVNPTFCSAPPKSGVVAGPMRNLTLAQALQFDCGSRHRASYAGQKAVPGARIPTLDAVLARYSNTRVQFFGEIKMPAAGEGTVDPVAFARLVEAKVRKSGLTDRFILQSFDWRSIDAMHAINPRIRTCLLGAHRASVDYLTLARQHHASCMVVRSQDVDAAQVRALRNAGILVFSDVVDDEKNWQVYLDKQVDALFTNDPQRAIQFLNKAKPSKNQAQAAPRY